MLAVVETCLRSVADSGVHSQVKKQIVNCRYRFSQQIHLNPSSETLKDVCKLNESHQVLPPSFV